MHLWRLPALSIHGVEGAFHEPGTKTVIPGRVTGKFSIRLVPDMDASVVEKQVRVLRSPTQVRHPLSAQRALDSQEHESNPTSAGPKGLPQGRQGLSSDSKAAWKLSWRNTTVCTPVLSSVAGTDRSVLQHSPPHCRATECFSAGAGSLSRTFQNLCVPQHFQGIWTLTVMTEETCRFIKMARGHVYPEHLMVTVPHPCPCPHSPGPTCPECVT